MLCPVVTKPESRAVCYVVDEDTGEPLEEPVHTLIVNQLWFDLLPCWPFLGHETVYRYTTVSAIYQHTYTRDDMWFQGQSQFEWEYAEKSRLWSGMVQLQRPGFVGSDQ
jgi:hypothetical protein